MGKSVNIIGGGLSGLVSAAVLAKRGVKVRLFERLPKVGGVVDSFTRKGYGFEATSHQFALPSVMRELYQLLGFKEDIEPHFDSNIYDVFYINGDKGEKEHLYLPSGVERCRELLLERFPADEKAIKGFFREIKGVVRDFRRLRGLSGARFSPFFLFDAMTILMLAKGREGGLLRLIGRASYGYLVKYVDMSWHDFMAGFGFSERLYSLLSQCVLYLSATPDRASGFLMGALLYSFMQDRPYLFKKGSHQFISKLTEVIKENGGEIHCNCAIERIKVESNRVEAIYDDRGNEYRSDFTLSTICTYTAFIKLIGEDSIADKEFLQRIKGAELSDSTFIVYVGFPGSLKEYGFEQGTSFFNYSYDIDKIASNKVPGSDSLILFSDYSYLNSDSKKSSFVLLEVDSYDCWKDIPYGSEEYRRLKRERESLIIGKFEAATGIPVRERAELIFSASPLTSKHYMGNRTGEMAGLRMTPDQILNRRPGAVSPVENLFLAGQYVHPSGGVSAVVSNGIAAARELVKRCRR